MSGKRGEERENGRNRRKKRRNGLSGLQEARRLSVTVIQKAKAPGQDRNGEKGGGLGTRWRNLGGNLYQDQQTKKVSSAQGA